MFIVLVGFYNTIDAKANSYTEDSWSYGRAENYDRNGHTTLGYMADNTSTYWSGSYSFSASKPRKPSDYYGEYADDGKWVLQDDYAWDESSVQDARNWGIYTSSDGYYWVSETGVKNRYRKGVYLHYTKTITDSIPPTLSAYISNVDVNGYDVIATATDSSGISRVFFPTWTESNGQDDLDVNWSSYINSTVVGTYQGNNVWKFHINRSEHNNEFGLYNTHVYAYDNAGNAQNVGLNATLKDSIITDWANITNATYQNGNDYWYRPNQAINLQNCFQSTSSIMNTYIYMKGSAELKIGNSNSRTWIDKADAGFYNATAWKVAGNDQQRHQAFQFYVDREMDLYYYVTAVTPYLTWANNIPEWTGVNSGKMVKIDGTPPTAPGIYASRTGWGKDNISYTITGSTDSRSGISHYEQSTDGGKTWFRYVDSLIISTEGWANPTIYARAVDNVGNVSAVSVCGYGIDRSAPTLSAYVANVDENGYDVIATATDSLSGVNRVVFPTWTEASGQDDLDTNWWNSSSRVIGTYQGSNTWNFHVNKSEHNNESGLYNTHVYSFDNVGNRVGSVDLQAILLTKKANLTNDIPSTLTSNTGYSFNVLANNTGHLFSWSESKNIKLGAVDDSDPFNSSNRILIPSGMTINEGQSHNFNIPMVTKNNGSFNTDWRMVEEMVTWFGDITSKVVNVISNSFIFSKPIINISPQSRAWANTNVYVDVEYDNTIKRRYAWTNSSSKPSESEYNSWQDISTPRTITLLQSKEFNGQENDFVNLGETNYNFQSGFTFEFDARWDEFNYSGRILDFGNGSASDNILIYNAANHGQLVFNVFTGGTEHLILTPLNAINIGETAHWKVKLDATGYGSIYKNGNLISQGQMALPNNMKRSVSYIGKSLWETDGMFKGYIGNLNLRSNTISDIENVLIVDKTFDGTSTDYAHLGNTSYDLSNGFSINFNARWDSLNNWSRIIDFGSGINADNIVISNQGTTNNLYVAIYRGNEYREFIIPEVITVGESADWNVDVDKNGYCKVYKNNILVGQEQLWLPLNTVRTKSYIGKSNWNVYDGTGGDYNFKGKISRISILTKGEPLVENITNSNSGKWYLHVESKNEVGDLSYKYTGEYRIDKVAPTLNLSQNPTIWTNDDVVITATASDSASGVKNIKLPNGTFVTGSSATYTVSTNGTYTFIAYDNAGNSTTTSITVTNIVSLELTNFRVTNMINPPNEYVFPILANLMPVAVKSGYNNTFAIDVKGNVDALKVNITDNLNNSLGTVYMAKIKDIDSTNSIWGFDYATILDTKNGTIIKFNIIGNKNTIIYDYNISNNWDGSTLKIIGSALDDAAVNRVY